jgi:prepilin-type N-terminal cleavage/methylation domain-containing protein
MLNNETMNKRNASVLHRGFTLIELLVVIAIIGILASIVLASLNSARQKGRDARRIADLNQYQKALTLYYDDNTQQYPTSLDALVPTFVSATSSDPLGPAYQYAALTDGVGTQCSSYHLGATLEQSSNSALATDADHPASGTACTGSASDFSGADPVYDIMP